MKDRKYVTQQDGYVDAMLRLVPPGLGVATEDYQDGYTTGFRERLYNIQLAIEELRYNGTV